MLGGAEVRKNFAKTRGLSWKRFQRISCYLIVLHHMLLHKLYINVAFANILLYSFSLYDLHKPKYENSNGGLRKTVFSEYLVT